MASSNIKLFDENKGNMLSDSEFVISNQRMNGLQTGVASSQLQNKAMYQASLVAYAIAQVMMQNGKNANDTDAVSAFVANLSGTMLQKVYDIATTAEAQAGVATGKWMSPALVKAAIDTLAAKAQNILSDNTKAMYGLGTDAVPDDVFFAIGKYSMYWWAKKHVPVYEVSIAPEEADITVSNMGSPSLTWSVSYSSSVVIDENGTVSLENPSNVSVSYSNYTNAQTLRGKYFYAFNGKLFYADSDANVTRTGSSSAGYSVLISAHEVTSKNTASEAIDYVQSADRNAYPDSGTYENYIYTFLGKPFDNAVLAGKPNTGSYVGTGLDGSANPVVISFNFKPKLIIVYSVGTKTNASIAFLTESSPIGFVQYLQSSMYANYLFTDWYDSRVEFYSDYANQMLNVSGVKYRWIAIY